MGQPGLLSSLPNQLTTLRLLLSFVLFYTIGQELWLWSLVVFAVAAVTDWLDGYFARAQGLVSSFGRAYDPLVDKVLVSGAFIFLLDEPGSGLRPWMVTIIVAREFIVTGLRGYLEERGVSFGADRWGKLKMVMQCTAVVWILSALAGFGIDLATPWVVWVRDLLNILAVVITIASGANYIVKSWRYLT